MLVFEAGRKVALIQRSCGYSLRPTLTIADIAQAIKTIKATNPNCIVLVDNCYGEFTEEREPGEVRLSILLIDVDTCPLHTKFVL